MTAAVGGGTSTAAFIAAAFLLIDPQLVTDAVGLVVFGAAVVAQRARPAPVAA